MLQRDSMEFERCSGYFRKTGMIIIYRELKKTIQQKPSNIQGLSQQIPRVG
jgi:hypothetical protein